MRALLPFVLLLGCSSAVADDHAGEGPVVIELFTSQGCSSCPPADALLGKLARAGALHGRTLAPLSFHVDYWNDLGWPDPFSAPAWTARQQAYARALGDDRVYTPELVVAGGVGLVGSRTAAVERAIVAAPRQLALPANATWQAGSVTVHASGPAGAALWAAVWEDGTRTKVTRGENSGETLAGERVVRALEPLVAGQVTISLARGWNPGGVVVLAQRADHHIVGAVLLPRR